MKNSNLQIRPKEPKKRESQYIPRDDCNNLLWQPLPIININVGLFCTFENLFFGDEKMIFLSPKNELSDVTHQLELFQ